MIDYAIALEIASNPATGFGYLHRRPLQRRLTNVDATLFHQLDQPQEELTPG